MAQLNDKQKAMRKAFEWCADNGKSMAFTIAFIAQETGATHDEVIGFLVNDN